MEWVPTNQPDTLNVQDECPTIVFGPHIDDKEDFVAPFYVTLNIHDKMLHNLHVGLCSFTQTHA
jgi:hypothetical protein